MPYKLFFCVQNAYIITNCRIQRVGYPFSRICATTQLVLCKNIQWFERNRVLQISSSRYFECRLKIYQLLFQVSNYISLPKWIVVFKFSVQFSSTSAHIDALVKKSSKSENTNFSGGKKRSKNLFLFLIGCDVFHYLSNT